MEVGVAVERHQVEPRAAKPPTWRTKAKETKAKATKAKATRRTKANATWLSSAEEARRGGRKPTRCGGPLEGRRGRRAAAPRPTADGRNPFIDILGSRAGEGGTHHK